MAWAAPWLSPVIRIGVGAGDRAQPCDGGGRGGSDRVGEGEHPDGGAVDANQDGGRPGVFHGGDLVGNVGLEGTAVGGGPLDGHGAPADLGADPDTGCCSEAGGGDEGQAALLCGVDDGGGQRVLAVTFRGGGQREHLVAGQAGAAQWVHGGEEWGAFGEGAGLVEGDDGGVAELFHDHGGLDQHAVPAGVGDRGQQRRHGGQHHRTRRRDDHEGHRA